MVAAVFLLVMRGSWREGAAGESSRVVVGAAVILLPGVMGSGVGDVGGHGWTARFTAVDSWGCDVVTQGGVVL